MVDFSLVLALIYGSVNTLNLQCNTLTTGTSVHPLLVPLSGIFLPSLNHSYVGESLVSARQVSCTELPAETFKWEGLAETISGAAEYIVCVCAWECVCVCVCCVCVCVLRLFLLMKITEMLDIVLNLMSIQHNMFVAFSLVLTQP